MMRGHSLGAWCKEKAKKRELTTEGGSKTTFLKLEMALGHASERY